VIFANTGDWLEHCTALVETEGGQLELWQANQQDWLGHRARRIAVAPSRFALG
jgi:hypothetical protein